MPKRRACEHAPRVWQALGTSSEAHIACEQSRAGCAEGARDSQHPRSLFPRAHAKYPAAARLFMHTVCCRQDSDGKICCGRSGIPPTCTVASSERLHNMLQALRNSHR